MGLAKVSLMALLVAMTANLRLTDTFHQCQAREERQAEQAAAGIRRRTRKPRWRTQQLPEMRQRMDQPQTQRQARPARRANAPAARAARPSP